MFHNRAMPTQPNPVLGTGKCGRQYRIPAFATRRFVSYKYTGTLYSESLEPWRGGCKPPVSVTKENLSYRALWGATVLAVVGCGRDHGTLVCRIQRCGSPSRWSSEDRLRKSLFVRCTRGRRPLRKNPSHGRWQRTAGIESRGAQCILLGLRLRPISAVAFA